MQFYILHTNPECRRVRIEFPDEPKQIRPGEDIRVTDGKVHVSGQVAVMAINEKLMQMLMSKNPDASFALQESFPLKAITSTARSAQQQPR